jgi:hypothetical protein
LLRRYFVSVRETSPRPYPSLQIFTLDIDGKPTLVFEAMGFAEASEICLDAELRLDLGALTSDGAPIYTENASLVPRPAIQAEIAAFKLAVELAPTSDEPTMAFLVKIDGVVVVAVGPE